MGTQLVYYTSMGTQAKQVPNSKYGVTMTEQYKLRMTTEQKQKLYSATADFGGKSVSTSGFWRDMLVEQADMLNELRSGELTPAEFGARMEQIAQAYLESTLTGNVQIIVSELETVTAEPKSDDKP